jgi:hypothetical protein
MGAESRPRLALPWPASTLPVFIALMLGAIPRGNASRIGAPNLQQGLLRCGLETDNCCYESVKLSFVEAAYLHQKMNQMLPAKQRKDAIERPVQAARRAKEISRALETRSGPSTHDWERLGSLYRESRILCPLSVDAQCVIYPFRPIARRIYGLAAVWRDGQTAAVARDSEGKGAAEHELVLVDHVRDTLKGFLQTFCMP